MIESSIIQVYIKFFEVFKFFTSRHTPKKVAVFIMVVKNVAVKNMAEFLKTRHIFTAINIAGKVMWFIVF